MRRCTYLLVSLAFAAAACESDAEDDAGTPPVHEARGGSSAKGGGSGAGGEDSAGGEPGAPGGGGAGGNDENAGGDAGDGLAGTPGTTAGAGGEGASGTGPRPVDELCPREPKLGTPEKLALSTDADERFGGITPDERVIAWTVTAGETVTLYVASRTDAEAAFGTPVSTALESALDGQVTLAPDGLSVAFVNADRRGFSVISRPTLDDAFGLATAGEFSLLDGTGGVLAAGQRSADPVLAGDRVSFYYSQYGEGADDTLRVSNRLSEADPWPVGGPLPSTGLSASGDDRFAPTGASRDGRTLFLWDSAAETTLLAFVDEASFEWSQVADIGPLRAAAPNGACSRLYYTAAGASLDLFVVAIGE